jgi:hypothetical protein
MCPILIHEAIRESGLFATDARFFLIIVVGSLPEILDEISINICINITGMLTVCIRD